MFFVNKNKLIKIDRNNKNLLIFSTISIPIAIAVLQFYHFVLIGPMANWVIRLFSESLKNFSIPYPFVASLLSLMIFGTAAIIWPKLGFGEFLRFDCKQFFVALCLVVISIISSIVLYSSFNDMDSIKKMGFVVWAITPIEEEIIFRGFLYSFLIYLFNKTDKFLLREIMPVILLGAVWFSFWHLSAHTIIKYGWRFMMIQLIATFVVGIFLNILRYWTRSIWPGVAVHAVGNFMFIMI